MNQKSTLLNTFRRDESNLLQRGGIRPGKSCLASLFFILRSSLFVLLCFATFTVKAQTTQAVADAINAYGTGGGTGGALKATVYTDGGRSIHSSCSVNDIYGYDLIIVENFTPITGATQSLNLNIPDKTVVEWRASLSTSPASNYTTAGVVMTTGSGMFCLSKINFSPVRLPGKIEHLGHGNAAAISTSGTFDPSVEMMQNTNYNAMVSGGIVSAANGNAISASDGRTVMIIDGEVTATNGHAIKNTTGHVSVGSTVSATNGNAIHTAGNVTVAYGSPWVSATNGDAIYAYGENSTVTVGSRGVVTAGKGQSATYPPITNDNAINAPGTNSKVTIEVASYIIATKGNAIKATGANSTVTINGGFVFAHGTAVRGAGNVIDASNILTPKYGLVFSWNRDAGRRFYSRGGTRDLDVLIGRVEWSDNSSDGTLSWVNGTHAGYFKIDDVTVHPFNEADGTAEDPYIIDTYFQLYELPQLVNSGIGNEVATDKYYKLGKGINYPSALTPIGTSEHPFKGVFDGDKHTIKLPLNYSSSTYTGLFGYIDGGTVKNLGITDANMGANVGQYAGGIAGSIGGGSTISNCYVTASTIKGLNAAGGIVGEIRNTGVNKIENCYTICEVEGTNNVGGLVGYLAPNGTVCNSAALNPAIIRTSGTDANFGRVTGNSEGTRTGNTAFNGMTVAGFNVIGGTATNKDGVDIITTAIHADGTIGGRFTEAAGWTVENGKLPGFGAAVDMPEHLKYAGAQSPNITTQPRNGKMATGTTYDLTVAAYVTDGGTLSYQWYSNTSATNTGGTAIKGATGTTYAAPINTEGRYYYYVTVTNTIPDNGDGGVKTVTAASSVATLTVVKVQSPVILTQPQSATVTVGTAHNLIVAAKSSDGGILSYQWYSNTSASNKGGSPIDNATGPIFFNLSTDKPGVFYYYAEVTNTVLGFGKATITTDVATLIVNAPGNAQTPVITRQPQNASVTTGTTHNLTVTATSSDGGTLSYQWYRNTTASNTNGTVVSGATKATYAAPISTAGTSYYYVVVTNTNNYVTGIKTAIITSNVATLTVNAKVNAQTPNITTHPQGATVTVGNTRNLTVAASVTDGGTLSYQWYKNTSASNTGGTSISGATNATYAAPISTAGTSHYYVVVTNTISNNGDGGTKTATVTSNVATLTVTQPTIAVTGVSLNKSVLTLAVGGTEQLAATVAPANATNRNVTWSSSNPTAATVSSNGTVTARAAGSATITVTTQDGGKTAVCTVTVTQPTVAVTGVSLNKSTLTLTVGSSEQLTATVAPANATNKNVTWSSSNTTAATVSSDGTVTAQAAGSATITVTTQDGGRTATCMVTVKEGVTGTEDLLKIDVKLFPNPFTDKLHLTGAEGCTLRIVTGSGVTVHVQKITNADESIPTEHLPAGMYLFRLEKDGKAKTMKGVKN